MSVVLTVDLGACRLSSNVELGINKVNAIKHICNGSIPVLTVVP